MSLRKCALCSSPIHSHNDTKEHVIPNAIGGRKKITGFICKTCNDTAGRQWDFDLSDQLNQLSLFFDITRDRGAVPSEIIETTGGEKVQLNACGAMTIAKPRYEETPTKAGINIKLNARSMREAKAMLAGLKRKYPQIEVDKTLESIDYQKAYLNDMLKLKVSFGGHKAGRSIVKTAMALAKEAGVEPNACETAMKYLIGADNEACFGFHYDPDLIGNRPEGLVFHCVSVCGNPQTKQILGYVEYFSAFRLIICLSNNYEGRSFSRTYAINPVSGKEIDVKVDFRLSAENVILCFQPKEFPIKALEKALEKIIPIGLSAAYRKERDRVVDQAVEYAFKNCGAKEGEILSPAHINKISCLFVDKITPFLTSQLQKRNTKP